MLPKNIVITNKGVVLLMVLMVILVVVALANVILMLISSQSRLTQHQVGRIQAYYAAQAGMNYAFEMLRIGSWVPNAAGGSNKYACLNGCIGPVAPDYIIPTDNDIPYHVQVTIYPLQSGINNNTTRLDCTAEYTYTP